MLFAALAGCEVRCFDQHQIVIEARHCPVGRGVKRLKGGAKEAKLSHLSTHTFRHLRLTHLARAGWKLHELTTYADIETPKPL